MPKLSIVIPTYTYAQGFEHLMNSFEVLEKQTFKDFNVIISDDSPTNDIEDLFSSFPELHFVYSKNIFKQGMAGNTNSAISLADGELIKILYQDDKLNHPDALSKIVEAFKDKDSWMASACTHTNGNNHRAQYNHQIFRGVNTIGSPSVITLRNYDNLPKFDEGLTWVLDCDFYKQLYDKFGEPRILDDINVCIGLGVHQTTHKLSEELKKGEIKFLIDKYA